MFVVLTSPSPVLAQAQDANSGLEVISNTVEMDVPGELTFSFDVQATAPIVELVLYWGAVDAPATSLALPTFQPGTRVTVTHSVDTSVDYLPPGLEISWHWHVVTADGVEIETEERQALYLDPNHQWRELRRDHATLWWYEGDDAFAESVLAGAEEARESFNRRFMTGMTDPIRIVLYANDEDFSEALASNSAEWVGGLAYPRYGLILAQLAPGSSASREIDRLIAHEVSHLVLHQATNNSYTSPPVWFDEGLAVYSQTTADRRLAEAVDRAVRDGTLTPLTSLNSSFPLDPDQALLAYGESESIIRFVIDTWGDAGIVRLIEAYQAGVTHEEAVRQALGLSQAELDAAWKAWLDYGGDRPPANETTVWLDLTTLAILGALAVFIGLLILATILLGRRWAEDHEEAQSIQHG